MESTEVLEMTYASNSNGISPEKKGESENGTPVEKQELKKEIMNETFEYGPLFLVSEIFACFREWWRKQSFISSYISHW